MLCLEKGGAALLAVLLSATPAVAQRPAASLDVQTAMVTDSVSGGETASDGGGSDGWFVRSDAALNGGRARLVWRLDSSSQVRRSPGGGPAGWDQQAATAAVTLRSTRRTTISATGAMQWSPRYSLGLPQPAGADSTATPAIEIPGVTSVTARMGGRLTHAFTRVRNGDAEYRLERVTAGGRTIITQRVAAGLNQQLGRHFSLALEPSVTRRRSSGASGGLNTSLETTVGLARRIGGATSVTAALIPSFLKSEATDGSGGTPFHVGGGATVNRRWSAGWRTALVAQQSLLSGDGYATPVYARMIGGSAAGRLGPLSVTGSASRVVGGQAAADGTRAPGGQSVSVAASRLLASHAAITAEYQQTRLQRAAPDPAGGATHLLNRRLRVAVTVGVR